MTRPRDEWRQDVSGRYKVLEHFSKEDARLQFLRILRSLPYGAPALPKPALSPLQLVPCPLSHRQHPSKVNSSQGAVLDIELRGCTAMFVRLWDHGYCWLGMQGTPYSSR